MDRIRRGADIQRVYREGRRFQTAVVTLHARRRKPEEALQGLRLTVVAGRKFPNAVARNRARRILREASRLLLAGLDEPWDLVLVARTDALNQPFRERLQTLRDVFCKAELLPPETLAAA
jgi:ribonuclease P protein component